MAKWMSQIYCVLAFFWLVRSIIPHWPRFFKLFQFRYISPHCFQRSKNLIQGQGTSEILVRNKLAPQTPVNVLTGLPPSGLSSSSHFVLLYLHTSEFTLHSFPHIYFYLTLNGNKFECFLKGSLLQGKVAFQHLSLFLQSSNKRERVAD